MVDHGKVFVSRNFRASCAYLGISLRAGRKSDRDRQAGRVERTLGSVASLRAQFFLAIPAAARGIHRHK